MDNPEDKLSLMYQFLTKFIKGKLEKDKLEDSYKVNKQLLYQLHFIIKKQDASNLVKLNFLYNIGVSMDVKNKILRELESGGDYEDIKFVFEKIDFLELLKVCKYFSYADKKLHSILYNEQLEELSEDLLSDFRDEESKSGFQQPESLKTKKGQKEKGQANVIVKETQLVSEHEYIFGTNKNKGNIIDTQSQMDFPTLGMKDGKKGVKQEKNEWTLDPFAQKQQEQQQKKQ